MIDTELQLLRERPDWQRLLHAYAARCTAHGAEAAGSTEVDGTEDGAAAADVPATAAGKLPRAAQVDPLVEEETVGWVPRLTHVDGLADEVLTAAHGKLIALGFLKFQLLSRLGGVVYRLTPFGRRAVEELRTSASVADAA